jgi:predicted metalloprotease
MFWRPQVDWTPGGISSDLEDRRDDSGGGGGGGGFGIGGGGGGGGLGIVGFIIVVVISLITGHNFLGSLFSGGSPSTNGSQSYSAPSSQYGPADASQGSVRQHPAGEDRDVQLISFVLDDVQKTWTAIFAESGETYRRAKLVVYRNATYSGCGTAQAATGPFYCPEDQKVYIDLSFWNELKRFGGSTADFAQAYVIAHELGHHVQQLLGIEAREQRAVSQDRSRRGPLSVDFELQADCFAGVWAHSTRQRGIVHPDDVSAALSAAAAVGDDHLQQMSGRAVSPESWTHGSSAQREHWFRAGLDGGTIQSCNTFNGQMAP